MRGVGYDALSTRISCAVSVTRAAYRYASTSNSPSAPTNFIRLRLARLQAVSLRNMYSEHGLLAWIRSVFADVCQSLIVVSYWIPGSPQTWAASAILRKMSFALYVSIGFFSTTE